MSASESARSPPSEKNKSKLTILQLRDTVHSLRTETVRGGLSLRRSFSKQSLKGLEAYSSCTMGDR